MAQYDMSGEGLRSYVPELAVPEDFAAFWSQTLAEAEQYPLAPQFTPVDSGLQVVDTFDVTFAGFGGAPVKGWLHLPAARRGPLPAVVEFVGYGGGRGLPHERNLWAQAGYAHFLMDTRGQGSNWSVAHTADPDPCGTPAYPGFMTRGVLDPHTYYYRRVFVDAVRAVAAARCHEAVDPTRVAVTGGSQGGGITLAVAGLVDDLAAVAPDVPFLCDFRRAVTLIDSDPYGEIVRYLRAHRDHVDAVLQTLSYFDGALFARRAQAPALFSVALMDDICPPSTVYAAFNSYGADVAARGGGEVPREIREYPFNTHEGGGPFHDVEKMRWLAARLRRS